MTRCMHRILCHFKDLARGADGRRQAVRYDLFTLSPSVTSRSTDGMRTAFPGAPARTEFADHLAGEERSIAISHVEATGCVDSAGHSLPATEQDLDHDSRSDFR